MGEQTAKQNKLKSKNSIILKKLSDNYEGLNYVLF